eukprot:CAMPEP_0206582226 /NCGR_PEP_ID=MMETSP0325_2-20121206/34340_1 /ASSEMBLY_ACC=CAM_ASM_000347 /TAXON_ID=2866 /ORGANISM="Crypthecodinium cohnii, Strain Seligo" /LENGTH=71 /DNA_ID=CAMNT_0054088831 /DNA_START=1 /DNA_END=216 /DNA_ORIENTATION=+
MVYHFAQELRAHQFNNRDGEASVAAWQYVSEFAMAISRTRRGQEGWKNMHAASWDRNSGQFHGPMINEALE